MGEQKTILIVDDDPDLVEQVSMVLKGAGFGVITADGEKDGEEALLKGGFDLAILDLMMEQTDSGFMLCHHAKRLDPDLPVILMTAVRSQTGISFNATKKESASWVKADKVIEKPVRPEQLLGEIRRLLGIEAEVAH
jgi:CheY-like chemotaxis protein